MGRRQRIAFYFYTIAISRCAFFEKKLECKYVRPMWDRFTPLTIDDSQTLRPYSKLHNEATKSLLPSVTHESSCAGSFICCPRNRGTAM